MRYDGLTADTHYTREEIVSSSLQERAAVQTDKKQTVYCSVNHIINHIAPS